MTERAQEKLMAKLCFGAAEDDPELICYAEQFLHGLNKFSSLYTASCDEIQPEGCPGAPAEMLLTMIPTLHQLGPEVNIYVGKGSIDKHLLLSKTVGSFSTGVSGRTMLRHAKDVLCNCKKMMAIVTASNSPYKDGNFPSGTNWDDYITWCIVTMKKEMMMTEKPSPSPACSAAAAATGIDQLDESSISNNGAGGAAGSTGSSAAIRSAGGNVNDTARSNDVLITNESNDVNHGSDELYANRVPFKGFLAWCLWGHIPIDDSTTNMKSLQFTDSKVGASYGRGTGSRRSLKAATAAATAAASGSLLPDSVRLDNRRGLKKQKRGSPKDDTSSTQQLSAIMMCDDDTVTTSIAGEDDSKILKEALDYLDSESLEKARQKLSMLSCLQVRDEISSLKAQVDSVSRRLYHAKNGSPEANTLLEKMDAIEELLREREDCLSVLQKEEANRQLKVIEERAAHLDRVAVAVIQDYAAKAGAAAQAAKERRGSHLSHPVEPYADAVVFTTPVKESGDYGMVSFATPTKSPAEAMLAIASQQVLLCMDCSITPTTHTCRRCKGFVCDMCCSTQRGLEMIWWCASCFDNESITNQETIRQGNYESDSD